VRFTGFETDGITDASDFLRKHPWPGRAIADTFDDNSHRRGAYIKRMMSALSIVCGRTGEDDESWTYDGEEDEERVLYDASETSAPRGFYWSEALQDSFREELEKYTQAQKWSITRLIYPPDWSSWTTSCGTRTGGQTTI
jgi:phosphatidylinositol 4-kinase type 2